MKNFINVLTPLIFILALVFSFLLIWQKQQHAHDEKMTETAANNASKQQSSVIELIQAEEEKSLRERVQEGVKATIAFVLSIFTKL
ncbi:MAG: hypothetical protein AABY93_10220 [Bacteroidota bacterium]